MLSCVQEATHLFGKCFGHPFGTDAPTTEALAAEKKEWANLQEFRPELLQSKKELSDAKVIHGALQKDVQVPSRISLFPVGCRGHGNIASIARA